MSEEEKFFAFLEKDGHIEFVYWTKTESEARELVTKWKRENKKAPHPDEDSHYYVGHIVR